MLSVAVVVSKALLLGLWASVRMVVIRPVLMVVQIAVGLMFILLVIGVIVEIAG